MKSISPTVLFLLVILSLCPEQILAQVHSNPRQVGMGSLISSANGGSEDAFLNPANLMVFERPQRWSISLPGFNFYTKDGFNSDILSGQNNYLNYLSGFSSTGAKEPFPTTKTREDLLKAWYPNGNLISYHEQKLDVHLFGIRYTGSRYGIAVNHRIRGESSFFAGRGWFDTSFQNLDGLEVLDRRLQHSYFLRHEISAGLSWEYDLVSGWLSDLSRVFVGINPKVVLPVSYVEHDLASIYASNPTTGTVLHEASYSGKSAGANTQNYLLALAHLSSMDTPPPVYKTNELFDFAGWGAGFDAGFTYILGIGNDVSLASGNKIPTKYSLRVSFSINDIGFVSFNKDPARWKVDDKTTAYQSSNLALTAKNEFTGHPSALWPMLADTPETDFILDMDQENTSAIRLLLPSRITAGIGLQLNRFSVSAEIQNQLSSWMLRDEGASLHFGGELKIIRAIPLRAGLIIQENRPMLYSAGIGFDLRNVELAVGMSSKTSAGFNEFIPVVSSVGSVVIRF